MAVKSNKPVTGPAANYHVQKMIPVFSRRIGSWQVAINRRPCDSVELGRKYDAVAGSWHRKAQRFQLETAYRKPLIESQMAKVLARESRETRVLDCGIGSGSLSIALDSVLPVRIAYSGIDVSREMLAAARNAMQDAGLLPELRQGDILSIPYPDQSFDVVMAAHVLEHLPEPQRAIDEMTRVLKPDGMLFVCMTRRSIFGTFVQLRWRTWAVADWQGAKWLQDCGLADIGFGSVNLGSCKHKASMAFWARRPSEGHMNETSEQSVQGQASAA